MDIHLNYENASFSRRKERRIAVHHDRSIRHRTANRAPIEQSRVCSSRSIGPRAPPDMFDSRFVLFVSDSAPPYNYMGLFVSDVVFDCC